MTIGCSPTQSDNMRTTLIHCFSHPSTPALLSRRVIMDTHSIRSLLPFHSCLCRLFIFPAFPPLTLFVCFFSLCIHVSCPGRACQSAIRSSSHPPKLDERLREPKLVQCLLEISQCSKQKQRYFSVKHTHEYNNFVHMGSHYQSKQCFNN